jgi:hypothetical protein
LVGKLRSAGLTLAASLALAAACLVPAAGSRADGDGHDHARADRVDPGALRTSATSSESTAASTTFVRSLGLPLQLVDDVPPPDPGEVGSWSAPLTAPLVPVFAALLPNGKVLAWDYYDPALGPEVEGQESNTRAIVWDPADGSSTPVNVCAGFTHLPNGNVYVAGGQLNVAGDPIEQTHVFDWQSNTWSRGVDMVRKRWYPSVAALSNGELLVLGGDPEGSHGQLGTDHGEVRQLDGSLRSLTGMDTPSDRLYPFLAPVPDGRVLYAGWDQAMQLLDTYDSGTATSVGSRDAVTRVYGSFAQISPGDVIVNGGGAGTPGTNSSGTLISFGEGTPATAPALAMARPRRHHYLTVLADGSVLATGGLGAGADDSLVDLDDDTAYVKAAELWQPGAAAWRELASAAKVRQYHSVAMLLPDGRVLTGGGGVCGRCQQVGYYENNFEIFTPPYLYLRDGSGQLAPRPAIDAAPDAIGYARTFGVTTASAASIAKVALVKLGAPTHAVDQGQRYVPLSFTEADDALTVSQPANAYEAPPGYYMLFLIDDQGVPSVSKIVKVGAAEDLFGHDDAPLRAYDSTAGDGRRQDFGRGVFRAARGHLADVGNDAISRLDVADGYRVLARDGSGGDGACSVFEAGSHQLADTPLDDAVSFLQVAPENDLPGGFECPPPPTGNTGPTGPTGQNGPTQPIPTPPEVRIARAVKPARRPISAFVACADGCDVTVRLSLRRRPLLRRTLPPSAKTRRLRFALSAHDLRRLRKASVRARSRITVTAVGKHSPPVVGVARFTRR